MSANVHKEYIDYNEATVTIVTSNTSYTISNILKTGQPSDRCKCHLESLTINSPVYSVNNPAGAGTTGEITIVDYADAVFNTLIDHMNKFLDGDKIKDGSDPVALCPKVTILIKSYTNNKFYIDGAHIIDWKMQFTGTTPSIVLSFTCIPPTSAPAQDSKLFVPNSKWTPAAAIAESNAEFPNMQIKCMMYKSDGNVEMGPDYMQFQPIDQNTELPIKLPQSSTDRNIPLQITRWIISSGAVLKGYDGYKIISYYDDSSKHIVMLYVSPEAYGNIDAGKSVNSGFIFSQNLNASPYSLVKVGSSEYINIPMTSFSFDTSLTKCVLQTSVRDKQGGSDVDTDKGKTEVNGDAQQVSAVAAADASNSDSQPITVSFDCYNAMMFNCNNLNSTVQFIVYNELGQAHRLCKNNKAATALVRSCTYTLEGAVVKAHIEATMAFNSIVNKSDVDDSTVKVHKEKIKEAEPDIAEEVPGDPESDDNNETENEIVEEEKEAADITIIKSKYAGHRQGEVSRAPGDKFKSPPKWITLHYTASANASAKSMCKSMSGNWTTASTHFYVDSKHIYSSVPLEYIANHVAGGRVGNPIYDKAHAEWNARKKSAKKAKKAFNEAEPVRKNFKEPSLEKLAAYPDDYAYYGSNHWRYSLAARNHIKWRNNNDDFKGNSQSIGVDFCCTCPGGNTSYAEDPNWTISDSAIENTAKLVAYLANKYNIDVNHIIRHSDATGKICPSPLAWPPKEGDEKWAKFKGKVAGYMKAGVTVKWVDEK